MTTASELKSAAVVEVESEVRKTDAEKINHNALKLDERCSRHDDTSFKMTGSTTATATSQVASTKAEAQVEEVTVKATPKVTPKARSGSKAASTFTAASIQATRLPVSVFPKIRDFSLSNRIQHCSAESPCQSGFCAREALPE